MKKILSLILSIFIVITMLPLDIVLAADNQDILAQYTGSTTASYGFKPDCTFTINKIVDGKFRGTFSATNLGRYNISQSVKGNVYENYEALSIKVCKFLKKL